MLKDLLEIIALLMSGLLMSGLLVLGLLMSFDGLLDDNSLWRLSLSMNKATVS